MKHKFAPHDSTRLMFWGFPVQNLSAAPANLKNEWDLRLSFQAMTALPLI
jgi:hypothetical protein